MIEAAFAVTPIVEHALATSSTLHPGMVIVVQRFRSDLGLFVHLHALVTDSCFEAPDYDAQEVRFWPTERLAGEHLLSTLQRLHADLVECALDEGEPRAKPRRTQNPLRTPTGTVHRRCRCRCVSRARSGLASRA